jgi:hypothetical protein
VIPKFHGAKLTDIPDDDLRELLVSILNETLDVSDHPLQPVAKKLVLASGAIDYNILQNNGRIAHQIVDHVSVSHARGVDMLTDSSGTLPHGTSCLIALAHC